MKKALEWIKNHVTAACRAVARAFSTAFRWMRRHLSLVITLLVLVVVGVGTGLALGLTLPVKSVEVEGEVILLRGEKYNGGFNIKQTTRAGLIHREEVLSGMISEIDTETAGDKEAIVSYRRWQIPVTIKVLDESDVTLILREGSMPTEYEPNDAFPKSGIFDLYYNGELIRSAPVARANAPGFTTKLSDEYDIYLIYRQGLSLPYHYKVLEVIQTITYEGALMAKQGEYLTKENAIGNLRLHVLYKDGTEKYVMIYDDDVIIGEGLMPVADSEYDDGKITLIYKGFPVEIEGVTGYQGELLQPKSVVLHLDRSVYAEGETFDYSSAYVEVDYARFAGTPTLLRPDAAWIRLYRREPDGQDSSRLVLVADGSEPITFDTVYRYEMIAAYKSVESAAVTCRVISAEDAGRITDITTAWRGGKDGLPKKGQELDFEDAVATVEYGFGYRLEQISLTADMVTGYDKDKAGDQELTLQYKDFRKTFTIRVPDVQSVEITSLIGVVGWDDPTYYTSDALVIPEGAYLEAEVGYGGSPNAKIYLKDNDEVEITGFTPHVIEEQELTIKYKGFSVKMAFVVRDDRSEEIIDFWAPKHIYYDVGEELDLSGECTVFYSTGRQVKLSLAEVLEMGGRMTPEDFDLSALVPGDNRPVRFYYPGFDWSDDFTWIHVMGDAPVSIKGIALEYPEKTYAVGDSIDLTGMSLYWVYTNNDRELIDADVAEGWFQDFTTAAVGENLRAFLLYASPEGRYQTEYIYSVA